MGIYLEDIECKLNLVPEFNIRGCKVLNRNLKFDPLESNQILQR